MTGGQKCCGNCAFWDSSDLDNQGMGACVFQPPNGQSVRGDCWWSKPENGWCGSWQPMSWREIPDSAQAKPRKSRQNPAKAHTSAVTVVPDQPTPKDVLKAWDANYASLVRKTYSKPQRGGEAKAASALIKMIASQDGDWERITRAIARFHADSFWRGKDFSSFCSKFAEFDGVKAAPRMEGFLDGIS